MSYPPKKHQDEDINHMVDVIKTYPLATLISVKENIPLVTHLPLVYEEGKLIGHIDIYNPQAQLLKDDNAVTIIFAGPECYISPSIYTTAQLPTWNYIKVHLKGKVKAIESKAALKSPDHKYTLEPDNPRLHKNLDYIEMFEIEIINWEGKFKLSQDKKPSDIKAAREELVRVNEESIKLFLDKVF
jgi:transcriptional regulator